MQLERLALVVAGRVVVLYFLASTAVCLALGIPILLASLNVKVYSVRYDDSGPMRNLTGTERAQLLYARDGQGVPLTVELLIPVDMKAPVSCKLKRVLRFSWCADVATHGHRACV